MEGQEVPQHVPDMHVQQKETWYTPLTRVTPLSKYLAMALFVALPFVGFWLGVGLGKQRGIATGDMPVSSTTPSISTTTLSEHYTSPELTKFQDGQLPFIFSYPTAWGVFEDSIPGTGHYWKEVRLPSGTGRVYLRSCPDEVTSGCDGSSKETYTTGNDIVFLVSSTSHKGNTWTSYMFDGGNGNNYLIQLLGPDNAVKGGDSYAPYDSDRDAWLRSKVPEYEDFVQLIDSIELSDRGGEKSRVLKDITKYEYEVIDPSSFGGYTNTEYGFTLDIPSYWSLYHQDHKDVYLRGVIFERNDAPALYGTQANTNVHIIVLPEQAIGSPSDPNEHIHYESEWVMINGIEMLRYVEDRMGVLSDTGDELHYQFTVGGNTYEIKLEPYVKNDREHEAFEYMIRSMQFTDSATSASSTSFVADSANESLNWQTYRNNAHGFALRYPNGGMQIPGPYCDMQFRPAVGEYVIDFCWSPYERYQYTKLERLSVSDYEAILRENNLMSSLGYYEILVEFGPVRTKSQYSSKMWRVVARVYNESIVDEVRNNLKLMLASLSFDPV